MTAIAIICTLIIAVGVAAFSMLFMLLILNIFEEEGCNDTRSIYESDG